MTPGTVFFWLDSVAGPTQYGLFASLLHMYGVIRKGNDALVPYAIRMLNAAPRRIGISSLRSDGAISSLKPNVVTELGHKGSVFALADDFKATFSRADCKPWFVGVWDTVSSVGWIENPLRLPYTADNPDIEIGRHAIAIDERRAFFRTNLWRLNNSPPVSGPKDLKQVWFVGAHSDVGGGYPEAESGLAKIALAWMIKEAEMAGLRVDPDKVKLVLGHSLDSTDFTHPDADAPAHELLTGFWWLAEIIPKRHYDWSTGKWKRRLNLGRSRTIPDGSLIHEFVYRRRGYRMRLLGRRHQGGAIGRPPKQCHCFTPTLGSGISNAPAVKGKPRSMSALGQ